MDQTVLMVYYEVRSVTVNKRFKILLPLKKLLNQSFLINHYV